MLGALDAFACDSVPRSEDTGSGSRSPSFALRHALGKPVLVVLVALSLLTAVAGAADADRGVRAPSTWPHGILFRVDHPGRPASYVFGTLHSADPRATAVAGKATVAMARTRTLAVEADLGPGDIGDFFAGAQLPEGQQLADWLAPRTMAAVEQALADRMDAGTVRRLKPWAAFLKLAEGPPTSAPTLDALLRAAARERHMAILGLELPEEQVAALDSIPMASQVALVEYVLRERAALASDHEAAVHAWLAGDLRALARTAEAPGVRDPGVAAHFAALRTALIDGRSALLAHRLFVPLRAGGVFVVVGASHLAGRRGLLALLNAQGYRITPLP